jgi:hypothetical protein
MRRVIAALLLLLLGSSVAACGRTAAANPATHATSTAGSAPTTPGFTTTSTGSSPPTTGPSSIRLTPADAPACALLLARIQRVTTALGTASELIAHSLNKQQLSHRIAIEKVQLRRSAQLLVGGAIPPQLEGADRNLVLGLNAFADDFARAQKPALRGDFSAAVQAMGDTTVVNMILGAAKTIQNACGAG